MSYEEKKARLINALQNSKRIGGAHLCLEKNSSNLFRPHVKEKKDIRLDISAFNSVQNIDYENLTAEVEGAIEYETLVQKTLEHNCLPCVVPQLKSITVGGAIAGCGIESSSFRFGLVHESLLEMDILLSDGRLVTCSSDGQNKDLFLSIPNTFGTLGYVLKAKIRLIPVKKYVMLTYEKFQEPKHFFEALQNVCMKARKEDRPFYIDGVIFHEKEMYICSAEFVDHVPYTSDYTGNDIFYRSIQNKTRDYLTTLDYIWRWDTDWFWCSDVFGMQNPLIRRLLKGVLLGSKRFSKVMHFFHRHPYLKRFLNVFYGRQESIIQDICIPLENLDAFYSFLQKQIGIYPIWICPTKSFSESLRFNFCPMDPGKLYFDFGFWKSIPTTHEEGHYNRMIEEMTIKCSGFKSLYSSSYYKRDAFWSIYDKKLYQEMKEKYDPENRLKDFYEKCAKNILTNI